MADGTMLRVATYNVHAWLGVDGRGDPDRTTRVIRSLEAAVVGLQEVTLEPDGPTGTGARYLAEATGMQVISGPTLKRGEADFGNALLTTLPIRAVRRHDLSYAHGEPRGLIDVDLDVRGLTLRVLSTHLGKGLGQRRWQARRILALLDEPNRQPVVLMGDINEWLPGPTCLRLFHRRFDPLPLRRTYPARLPLLGLDRIWVQPTELARSIRVVRSGFAATASDHLPLLADLEVPPPPV